jgi:peptidyl-prolyl cis-trans isomerase A (cyclophilin A)
MKRLIFFCTALALLAVSALAAKDREPGLYATLDTSMGKIVIKLFEKEAPVTVKNFVDLATGKKPWKDSTGKTHSNEPFYDGVIFHRVIGSFMVQTGAQLPDGSYRLSVNIPDEIVPSLKFDRAGRVAMANTGQPNTGNTQFFITHGAVPQLNGGYTIFGQVVEGQGVVNKMPRVKMLKNEMGEMAKPASPITLSKVTIERVGPAPESKE